MNAKNGLLPEDKIVIAVTSLIIIISLFVTADIWYTDMARYNMIFLTIIIINVAAMSVITILYVLFYCNVNIHSIVSEVDFKNISFKLKCYFAMPIIIGFNAIIFGMFVFLGGGYINGAYSSITPQSAVITIFVGSVAYVVIATYRVAKLYPQLYHTSNRVKRNNE